MTEEVNGRPMLLPASAAAVRAEIQDRIPSYTPDWRNPDRADAGVALVRLFGLLAEPVLQRANRLPDKALVEYLRLAGVTGRPPAAATALLQVTVSPAAGASVTVPAGYQVGAPPATGQGDEVVFETERTLYATPSAVVAAAVEQDGVVSPATLGRGTVRPFGSRPKAGNALWIALSTPENVRSPSPSLTLGVVSAAGPPPPASAGTTGRPAPAPQPLLVWELLDGSRMTRADVIRDETAALRRTGVVELAMPPDWTPGRPPGAAVRTALRWLRARLVAGAYPVVPELLDVRANLTRAAATRTIRDEALERLGTDADGRTRMSVSQTPVLPGSLEMEVDDDPLGDLFGTGARDARPPGRWREVASLAPYGAADRVFVLDPATGVVTTGDGVHGARVPDGFRNVRARVYRAGGGASGAVPAGAVTSVRTSITFVTEVVNPFPASGGTDAEPSAETVRRGGQELRAGERAVAAPDYGVLALRSDGAQVARAYAVSGLHPDFPGRPIPGVVGVFVVPPDDAAHTAGGPPAPTAEELRAVAGFLAAKVAPAGVEVVAAAPRYHRVGIEARVVLDPADDQADVLRRALRALDTFLHPLRGGADRAGWPFGAPLRHVDLLHQLLGVPGVLAAPQLAVVIDGRRRPPCADTPLTAHSLIWPARHELLPVEPGRLS